MIDRLITAAKAHQSSLVIRRKGKVTTVEKGVLPFGKLSLVDDIFRQHNVWDGWVFGGRDGSIEFRGEVPEKARQKLRNVIVR